MFLPGQNKKVSSALVFFSASFQLHAALLFISQTFSMTYNKQMQSSIKVQRSLTFLLNILFIFVHNSVTENEAKWKHTSMNIAWLCGSNNNP